jgi:hypothetical protein
MKPNRKALEEKLKELATEHGMVYGVDFTLGSKAGTDQFYKVKTYSKTFIRFEKLLREGFDHLSKRKIVVEAVSSMDVAAFLTTLKNEFFSKERNEEDISSISSWLADIRANVLSLLSREGIDRESEWEDFREFADGLILNTRDPAILKRMNEL